MPFIDEVAKLLAVARPVSYPQGARLVRQGEASRGAFVLRTGVVEAQVALPGGGMLTVAELGAGDVFGEMALIERGSCSASVVARSDVAGWFIARDDFRAMVASRDPAALDVQRAITRVLAAKLRALNAKVLEHPAAEDRPVHEAPKELDLSGVRKPSFDWRAFLPLLRFFEGFERDEIDALAAGGRVLELERGAWLFCAGRKAEGCFLVVRGALEVLSVRGELERRVALAGPGEIVGYLAVLDDAMHAASARVRESACVLEFPAPAFVALYQGAGAVSVKLQHAIHASMLRSLARTNNQLTRLISHARLAAAPRQAVELEAALHAQLWRAEENVNSS
jgi:CRP-like cAMP-binding protein